MDEPNSDPMQSLRQQVESLRLAGVQWVPAPQAVNRSGTAPAKPQLPAASQASGVELFPAAPMDGPPMPRAARIKALTTLNDSQVKGCTRCSVLVGSRTQTVFGVGNVEAELVFVGEAPGADEDAQGEPFVGAAGQLLNRIIAACKMQREDVYICNVLKCRPPANRTPLPDEVANCMPFLERQLEIIRPKFICALGAVAAQALLQTTQGIGKLRGRFHDYRGSTVVCTYHPAYLLRNPAAKRDVWDDMKRLMARMGRPVE